MKNNRILVQTRVPSALRIYLKAYAKQQGKSLDDSCEGILSAFFECAPWQQGFVWRIPQSHRTDSGESQGWAQFNVWITAEYAAQIESIAVQQAVSKSAVLYSAWVWFAQFIAPPRIPS